MRTRVAEDLAKNGW